MNVQFGVKQDNSPEWACGWIRHAHEWVHVHFTTTGVVYVNGIKQEKKVEKSGSAIK